MQAADTVEKERRIERTKCLFIEYKFHPLYIHRIRIRIRIRNRFIAKE